MHKLLKQKTTGHIYVWTENLAARDDMEDYALTPEPAQAQENTSENQATTSAEVPPATELEAAKAAFRRQVTRAPRKPRTATSEA
jgi:HAMP domain-containing protein